MASRTPTVLRSENFYIHRGKGSDLAKADLPKPSKAGRQERKALRDVSNTALRDVSNIGKQPPLSSASKSTISKEKSALRTRETPKNATNNSLLSDEEIKRCHEWAKEGIEQIHFTGNDLQKLQQDKKEQSVRKKVDKVTLALHAWSDIIYCNAGMSLKVVSKSNEDKTKMELEPEVLPPMTKLHSDNKELELLLFEPQLDHLSDDHTFELNPKDNSGLEPETTAFTTISIKKPPASGHTNTKDPQA